MSRDPYTMRAWTFLTSAELSTAARKFLSEKKQWLFLRRQEVLRSPKDKLSRVVANYPVIQVQGNAGQLTRLHQAAGQAPPSWLPDMLVVTAEELVDIRACQECKQKSF